MTIYCVIGCVAIVLLSMGVFALFAELRVKTDALETARKLAKKLSQPNKN